MQGWIKQILRRFPTLSQALLSWRDQRAVRDLSVTPVPGQTFSMRGGNWFAAGVYQVDGKPLHEAVELELVGSLLREGDVLIDVGANSGLFSLMAASKGIHSIAMEPMSANVSILLENIAFNGFAALIEVFPMAAANKPGILPIFGTGQSASLMKGWGGQMEARPTLVPTNTIDNLFSDRLKNKSVVLKVDAEGAELEVLRGATGLLGWSKAVLVENSLSANHPSGFNPDFESVFHMLWELGYSAHIADATKTLVTDEMLQLWVTTKSIDIGTENFLFLRR